MKLVRTGDFLTVRCPAKINLFLEVHGVRPDGYHEIETVMQTITLYDEITLRPHGRRETVLRCSDPRVPSGPENLACRAAELVAGERGLPAGVAITLRKRIPPGAGLGGGSSDAAGVLAGVNQLFGLGLGLEDLSGLAARLGSDVAFFLHGGTAVCTGRGERVRPVPSNLAAHVVVYCPPVHLSSADVYQNLSRLGLTSGNRSARLTLDYLGRGDFVSVCSSLFNRLDEAAVSLVPEVGRAKELLARAASRAALVSGSGSAVYVLLDSADQAAAVAERMRAEGAGRAFLVQTESPACV